MNSTDQKNTENSSSKPELSSLQHVSFDCPVDHHGTTVRIIGLRQPENKLPPVILVHDLGEHISMYAPLGEAFGLAGCNVYGFDFPGHGESGGSLGSITGVTQLVHNLLQVVALVRHEEKGKLPVIMAQGISALIALFFFKKFAHLSSGLVLVAPCFKPVHEISRLKSILIKSLAEIAPHVKVPKGLAPQLFCSVKTVEPLEGDRKSKIITRLSEPIIPRVSISFVSGLLDAVSEAPKILLELKIPCLILGPSEDKISVYEDLQVNLKNRDLQNIRFENVEGRSHNFLIDTPHEDLKIILDKIVSWIGQSQVATTL